MNTITNIEKEVNRYWRLIEDSTSEIKLSLIKKITDSLLLKNKMKVDKDKEETQAFLKRFAGAWDSNMTTEELITVIRENHSCKNPVNLDI